MIQEHINHKDWYIKAFEEIHNKYFPLHNLFIDILSATSPRKSVKANLKITETIIKAFNKGTIINKAFLTNIGLIRSCHQNVWRALKGQPLSGDKVRAFAENLKGNLEAVTIDVWVKRYFKIPDKKSLTTLQYQKLAAKIKRNAKRHKLKPAEYQAVIWTIIRKDNGFKPTAFKV